ncbi:MAG: hypothetical protein CLLPBCKN_007642 [Chroococcidiopsis cubana SAG 39.79]|uniref:Uncharacterized protein n=1 Tax=Chroococcidiopsis cubana SAG 39.79 TaxID=388085 RepID=A0AB37UUI8_9CYAN|nr:hypothetical protein [Chroococcidiopsis cubana]MDZ4878207.1 hypothetical protein [Chroococcidiopsis cubana SAG 39.79]PSB66580.1 hypothetical protein C7B79_00560 [Chroococcidiopsis cubana CCALA 043]RUT14532.1 hypothetical protein DSM107010_00780 [Chroococcidiopsis cubana SAG 39.79]
MVQYSRLKRFLNQNKKEINSDGSLKAECAEGMRSRGMSEAAITDFAARLKAQYERLKQLDETDPEQWVVYTAYDVIFTEEEKQQFNPDGSLRQEYQQDMQRRGYSENWLEEKERLKKIEVENFEQLSVQYAQVGINFPEQQAIARASNFARLQNPAQMYRLRQDIRNAEKISELSIGLESDDYEQQRWQQF